MAQLVDFHQIEPFFIFLPMSIKINPKVELLINWELDNIFAYLHEGIEYYITRIEKANNDLKLPKLSEKERQ